MLPERWGGGCREAMGRANGCVVRWESFEGVVRRSPVVLWCCTIRAYFRSSVRRCVPEVVDRAYRHDSRHGAQVHIRHMTLCRTPDAPVADSAAQSHNPVIFCLSFPSQRGYYPDGIRRCDRKGFQLEGRGRGDGRRERFGLVLCASRVS